MLDIQYIRDHVETIRQAVLNKRLTLDVDALLAADQDRRALLREVEELQSLKNDINDLIQQAKTPEERTEVIAKGKEIKAKLEEKEPLLAAAQAEYNGLMAEVPNVPSDDTPIGKDESENKVLRTVGDIPQFAFQPKEHWELGAALDIIDTERAVKISGSRFAYLKGDAALLQFALIQYVFSVLTNTETLRKIASEALLAVSDKPFVPIVPPVLVKTETLSRMARLEPKEERYAVPGDDLYLVGSAEHSIGSMYMDETLDESALPLRYIGFSSAFRREAGSYGKDMKGILRLHQFEKLEMESFEVSERSRSEHDFFTAIQEYLMRSLSIPYQVVLKCTGDMGTPNARAVDIEAWIPGQNKYRETHTADLMTDYQARRLNTKVKRTDGRLEMAHMNDGTAFAIDRTLIAILENYQQEDGSVVIPEVLRSFVGKDKIEKK